MLLKIHVKYFSTYREAAGLAHETVTVDDGLTLGSLEGALMQLRPGLRPFQEEMMFAVNKEYATRNQKLMDGDEVALLPPVSGG